MESARAAMLFTSSGDAESPFYVDFLPPVRDRPQSLQTQVT